jgi:aminoglycoside phosphotransferase (APT) family kinase protein
MTERMSKSESRKWLRRAKAIVTHHLGSPPLRIARQTGGISNLVYGVRHHDGDFILRLSPHEHKLEVFRKEQYATEKARAAGVPTAQILYVGAEAVPCPYMVQTWVRGQEATHHPRRLEILREIGRLGTVINSIETAGFGREFADLPGSRAPLRSWCEFLRRELELERRLGVLVEHDMVDADKAERLRAVLEAADRDAGSPRLNHGDLRLKNVLVDDHGEVTAVIDWEHCVSALAPVWEWSIALHDLSIDAMQAFLRGYGASREAIERLAPVVKALNIINYVPAIERLLQRDEPEHLDWIRTRMSGALDLYSL